MMRCVFLVGVEPSGDSPCMPHIKNQNRDVGSRRHGKAPCNPVQTCILQRENNCQEVLKRCGSGGRDQGRRGNGGGRESRGKGKRPSTTLFLNSAFPVAAFFPGRLSSLDYRPLCTEFETFTISRWRRTAQKKLLATRL